MGAKLIKTNNLITESKVKIGVTTPDFEKTEKLVFNYGLNQGQNLGK